MDDYGTEKDRKKNILMLIKGCFVLSMDPMLSPGGVDKTPTNSTNIRTQRVVVRRIHLL